MPDDLNVLWPGFIADWPRWWLEQKKGRLGNKAGAHFIDFMSKTIEELGKHCKRKLHTGEPQPRSKKDGDPEVFIKWVRKQISEMNNCGGKSVVI